MSAKHFDQNLINLIKILEDFVTPIFPILLYKKPNASLPTSDSYCLITSHIAIVPQQVFVSLSDKETNKPLRFLPVSMHEILLYIIHTLVLNFYGIKFVGVNEVDKELPILIPISKVTIDIFNVYLSQIYGYVNLF